MHPPQYTRESAVNRDDLAQAIIDLEGERVSPLQDAQLAYELGHRVKPLIDRLVYEPPSRSGSRTRSREMEDRAVQRKRATRRSPSFDKPAPELTALADIDKARWIFMERFIPLDTVQNILQCAFTPEERDVHHQALERFLARLFLLSDVASALEAGDLPALQKMFASTLLLFRHAQLGDDSGGQLPCTLAHLRLRFSDYFYRRRNMPNWYETQPFYTAPLPHSRWVLCDIDYLNCTLRQPQRRLSAYAQTWSLSAEASTQKTALEDIYDRIVCGEALGEHLFEQNCNSCTTTSYQKGRGAAYQVYTVQKDQKIAIHGKVGLPHWRTSRRLWPGVFPTLIP